MGDDMYIHIVPRAILFYLWGWGKAAGSDFSASATCFD
jgi:hypothetical protein